MPPRTTPRPDVKPITSDVNSELKSKVIFRRENYDPVSVSYMDLLRSQAKSKKIYPVDPYCEVYQFRDNVYALLTDNLDGGYNSWMFLVVGSKKAFLVDTSYGLGDLHGLVDELTGGKEVIVGNTHCSFDHSYGNCRFDDAYCHTFSGPYMEERQNPHIWDYLFFEDGRNIWNQFPREDLPEFRRYNCHPVEDGYTFNIGTEEDPHEIELIWLPGHQPGHAGFLDKKDRILFSGDDIISMRIQMGDIQVGKPYAEYGTVEAYYNQFVKLEKRLDEFDRIFPGHFCLDIDSRVVHGCVKAAKRILDDPDHPDFQSELHDGRVNRFVYVEGLGTMCYGMKNVYMKDKLPKEE